MYNTLQYNVVTQKLRAFFQEEKGFLEVPTQSRLSILAACEDPFNICNYTINGVIYPLPQTGQMWLEHELLKNPSLPGVFCCSTSYRDEKTIIPGRHFRVFPMFEFESHGSIEALKKLEKELLLFLGFDAPTTINYEDACKKYDTQFINATEELYLERDLGSSVSLEYFPERTSPFWNMKRSGDVAQKIDVILYGWETIGSAERSCDRAGMRECFLTISEGKYAQKLFDEYGKERVLQELEEFLAHDMFERFGGGIGIQRLVRAMEKQGIIDTEINLAHPRAPYTQTFI